jgi:hypothetical protein
VTGITVVSLACEVRSLTQSATHGVCLREGEQLLVTCNKIVRDRASVGLCVDSCLCVCV